ncbi:MAG TPA: primosomal protein [Caulobacteraceae bacterium]|nr:primosomal protein [Caulobacteraceae bacterium]
MPDVSLDSDSQDLAETFDETNITNDGGDIADPDMAPDVFDVTQADDDAEDEALEGAEADSFDPDAADEAELEAMLESDDGVDEPNPPTFDNEEIVATDDRSSADYEPKSVSDEELAELGYRPKDKGSAFNKERREQEKRLDEGLEETFPASDPVSISPGSD